MSNRDNEADATATVDSLVYTSDCCPRAARQLFALGAGVACVVTTLLTLSPISKACVARLSLNQAATSQVMRASKL